MTKSVLLIITAIFLLALDLRAQEFKPVTCVDPDRPKESLRPDINGIALISNTKDETRFLVVIDYGAALLTVTVGGNSTCTKLKWAGRNAGPEKQLEALTSIPGPGRDNEFLALQEDGVIYHIKHTNGKVEIIGDPFAVPNNKPENARDFEGLAVQKLFGGEYVIAWATRGRDKDAATLFWSKFNIAAPLSTASFTGSGEVAPKGEKLVKMGSEGISVPDPTDSEVRHISDLKIDTSGAVFIVSASDTLEVGSTKPFSSAFYVAGVFGITGGKTAFIVTTSYTPLMKFAGQKVEALELVPGEYGGVAFAADNEAGQSGGHSATLLFAVKIQSKKP